jgi:coniferyl-aldehyde dehydrogenase
MSAATTAETKGAASMAEVLKRQKAANIQGGAPSAETRIDRLDRCIKLLIGHETQIVKALNEDFGNRAAEVSGVTDIAGSIGPLKYAKASLKAWMKPEKRKTTPALLGFLGAKAEVRFQPKGVVGIISPWNFPVNLTFAPLAGVLAAGNRAMIKPSEYTPATSELMRTCSPSCSPTRRSRCSRAGRRSARRSRNWLSTTWCSPARRPSPGM